MFGQEYSPQPFSWELQDPNQFSQHIEVPRFRERLDRYDLSDDCRARIWACPQAVPQLQTAKEEVVPLSVTGVHGILRPGTPWRYLLAEVGKWYRVFRRFRRWCELCNWTLKQVSLAESTYVSF